MMIQTRPISTSIPIDNCEDDFAYPPSHNHHRRKGGGGEAVGLKPFNRSTIDMAAAFAAVGSSLFCIGGLELTSCSSKGGCDMGYSFNRGERVGEWGGHDHARRSCGLGGYGGGRGIDCFKCGVTGHMARDCHQVGGGGGGRYVSGSGGCGGRRGGGCYACVDKGISPKNARNAAY
ncbi:hypothetical protein RHGRI_005501 [Rhododendron griersonianum]|uniref:CCHC-type domain-containing protein n=1 Tax=Rhododendron griersonianum TaxID=479676 RepID=A0AAV6LCJ3_9ERIC|nr:hypothetical protein RHGRI_005501 [Rhododendron griersonianum]